MPIIDLKKKLYQAIDAIQDEKLLAALIIILSAGGESGSAMELGEADVQELNEREARFDSGENHGVSLDAFKYSMRTKYGI